MDFAFGQWVKELGWFDVNGYISIKLLLVQLMEF